MKRKIVSLVLSLLLLCAMLPTAALASDSPFTDVETSDLCYDAVLWALENGVTNGTSATTFSPDKTCTRGQVVTFLYRANGSPEPQSSYNPFADVKKGSYYEKAILWAVERGITNGTSATAFSPEMTCSCAHILTFLWRAMGRPEPGAPSPISNRFPDDFYSGPVSWAEYNGLLAGMEDGFEVKAPCPRGATVTYLFRANGLKPDEDGRWNPIVIQRQVILDGASTCGALLVGVFAEKRATGEMIYERAEWDNILLDAGVTEDYPFVSELPNRNIVQTGGGQEIYLIVPLDTEASVAVNRVIWRNGKAEVTEILHKNEYGEPFLLCCNSDPSQPDTQVVVVDSNGTVLTWYPRLDGKQRIDVKAEHGPSIYDLTIYPEAS